ncbi:threonine synthase [Bacillus cereus]|uniref:threonine synthase n=1 Tax=Bacillus cereus TaxID=1396 RepID=UPI0018F5A380|nr:threonine synthase [Bacillus cereus]MBJ7966947.1 threonine synthase [Bacillus cereus]MBJ8002219.1 threonine synthase [Bacillus cereus]
MEKCWLKCNSCNSLYDLHKLIGKCECGGILLVEYNWEKVIETFTIRNLKERCNNMWRYFEILPIKNKESIISFGEGMTPLIRLPKLEKNLAINQIFVKREEQNPTGSFKARGFSSAISLLYEYGINKVAVPSNGNAASALAAYSKRAGMHSYVVVPKDCSKNIIDECEYYGSELQTVDGYIHDAGHIIEKKVEAEGWFNVGTLREPGRLEGKKTMGYEVAEQLDWEFPDIIIYPTGGGSGVIGMWKAFKELKKLGLVKNKLPKMIIVQEKGCDPIVKGIQNKSSSVGTIEKITSSCTGMRVPFPPAGDLILSIIRETNGTAISVSNEEIHYAQKLFGHNGISSSPEGAAALAGLITLKKQGLVSPYERIVLFNTSHALKYSVN